MKKKACFQNLDTKYNSQNLALTASTCQPTCWREIRNWRDTRTSVSPVDHSWWGAPAAALACEGWTWSSRSGKVEPPHDEAPILHCRFYPQTVLMYLKIAIDGKFHLHCTMTFPDSCIVNCILAVLNKMMFWNPYIPITNILNLFLVIDLRKKDNIERTSALQLL